MRGVITLLALLFLATPALAQNNGPLVQSGRTTSGDIPKWVGTGKLGTGGDTRGDANGKGVNPFAIIDRDSDGLCIRTGPVSSPHNVLCFGHKTDGTPLISVDSLGGMAAKQLRCRINGVENDCFSGGVVVNPPPSSDSVLALNSGQTLGLNSGADLGLNAP